MINKAVMIAPMKPGAVFEAVFVDMGDASSKMCDINRVQKTSGATGAQHDFCAVFDGHGRKSMGVGGLFVGHLS